jgi:hypothetical protein
MGAAKRKIGVVSALFATAALGGCGDLGELSGRVEEPQLVTKRDIERYPADSPARTALGWWRALQFNSPTLAASYYSDRLHLTPARLRRQLKPGPSVLDLRSGMRIEDVVIEGDRATVFVTRTRILEHPNGRTDKVRNPDVLEMRRETGGWKLADNHYIVSTLRAVRAFVRNGSKPKSSP